MTTITPARYFGVVVAAAVSSLLRLGGWFKPY